MRAVEISLEENQLNHAGGHKLQRQAPTTPQSPDPALLDVKQKLLLFENLQADERIIFKTSKFKSKSSQSLIQSERQTTSDDSPLVQVYPMDIATNNSINHASIDEERSEDEVESLEDELNDTSMEQIKEATPDDFGRSISLNEKQLKDNTKPVAAVNKSFLTPIFQHSKSHQHEEKNKTKDKVDSVLHEAKTTLTQSRNKEFARNYRSRPKTEVLDGICEPHISESGRFLSLHHKPKKSELDDEEQIELRDKSFSCVQPILEELIKTEESRCLKSGLCVETHYRVLLPFREKITKSLVTTNESEIINDIVCVCDAHEVSCHPFQLLL
ncbi:hypothetical protein EVAR_72446_1 [Eumeta japonica]|uniref:Uncharacterized protein n=1 Tax=Eumeta variegata TaxID=151549 RepID=A0A4C1T2C6_EUMVA|nr:hypothetical protein EVAR_72446_1 [Eumeta japonica]